MGLLYSRTPVKYYVGQKVLFHVILPDVGIDEWREAIFLGCPKYNHRRKRKHACRIAFADTLDAPFETTWSKIKAL